MSGSMSPDGNTIDDIADQIEDKLNIRGMSRSGYRNLAEQLARLSVSRNNNQDASPAAANHSAGNSPAKPPPGGGNPPTFMNNRNENVYNPNQPQQQQWQQPQQMNNHSAAPLHHNSTTAGAGPSQQPKAKAMSPPQRARGRSPARSGYHDLNHSSSSSSKHQPRAHSTNSSGVRSFRRNSPIRNLWGGGGNKIPPAPAAARSTRRRK